jgi:hypothetical protein
MTIFAEDLFAYLSIQATNAANRIHPNQLPQNPTFPAVRYFLVSDPPEHTHSGRANLYHPRYQLECYDQDTESNDGYLGAHQLALQVITALDLYQGAMGTATCQVGFTEDAKDNFDPETNRHWVSVDVEIWYSK